MFAPESGSYGGHSLRNTRRRQRTSLEDSVKPPDAKRHRSALRREPAQPSVNKDVDFEKENGFKPSAGLKRSENDNKPREERSLAIRSSEKTSKATTQTDHTVILVRLYS